MNLIQHIIIAFTFLLPIKFIQASDYIDFETVFNTPGFNGQSTTTIEDKIAKMIQDSAPHSLIRVSLYTVSREQIVNELVYASQRGVNVKIILDGKNRKLSIKENNIIHFLKKNLICNDITNDCLTICKGPLGIGYGCRGIAINHNKFFLFSKLNDGSENIVASTSANMNPGQLKMYNDLLIVKNDKSFFDRFMKYWSMLQQDDSTVFENPLVLKSTNSKIKAYVFPRVITEDPVIALLNRISCQLPNSIIRLAQSIFTRKAVADKLSALESQGCKVEAIVRSDSGHESPSEYVKYILKNSLTILPFRGLLPEKQTENSIHSKIILINASLDGSINKVPLVLAGSHNLNASSLYFNDEILIELSNQAVFDNYNNFFNTILNDAKSAGISFL